MVLGAECILTRQRATERAIGYLSSYINVIPRGSCIPVRMPIVSREKEDEEDEEEEEGKRRKRDVSCLITDLSTADPTGAAALQQQLKQNTSLTY